MSGAANERPRVVLASASRARAAMLQAAGVAIEIVPARVDEDEVKLSLRAEDAPPHAIAETLAELKAVKVSRQDSEALVIGADQVLAMDDRTFDKPPDLARARTQLQELRGREHSLVASVVLAKNGSRIWHHNQTARLSMRPFSDAFLDDYLATVGARACASVGGYELEGLGAQLFDRVEGDYFTVLGLPLLPLLTMLRTHGAISS